MHYLDSLPTAAIILIQIFVVIIIILWALLPFAVFGLKARLDKLNNTAQYILNELESKSEVKSEPKSDVKSKPKRKHIEPRI